MKQLDQLTLENQARQIEKLYAAVQGTYNTACAALLGFTAVYLASFGLSNTMIGYASAALYLLTIILQAVIADYADAHPDIPIRRLILCLFAAAMLSSLLLQVLALPVAASIMLYLISAASQTCVGGLNNAYIVQFMKAGIPVSYGWPRGIGSITYASFSYVIGIVLAHFAPSILIWIFLAVNLSAVAAIAAMPVLRQPTAAKKTVENRTTYFDMLKKNRTLVVFLASCIALNIGQAASSLFLVRIINLVGGGTQDLGLAIFIQSGIELPALLLSPWLLRRFHAGGILLASYLFTCLKMIMLASARSLLAVDAAMAVSFFVYGFFCFASVIFVAALVPENEQVRAQMLVIICQTVGSIIGAAMAGNLIDAQGVRQTVLISSVICAAAAGIMAVCWQMDRRQGQKASHSGSGN